MNLLFDISHPAHFHLYKNTIRWLKDNGHRVLITVRKKGVLFELLDKEGLDYCTLVQPHYSYVGLAWEVVARDVKMFSLCRKFKPDLLIGTSANIAHVGKLIKRTSIVFNADDAAAVPFFAKLAYPYASAVVKPDCLSFEKGKKDIYHPSFHQLAYLHPNNFRPQKKVLGKYGLKEKEYVVARFSALKAHHDVGIEGISGQLWEKIKKLIHAYYIVKSVENEKSHEIEPWDMHHVLAFSKMAISDSQTMTAEAAILGVPALRYNSFVGRISYLEELQQRYDLTYGFKPGQDEELFSKIEELLSVSRLDIRWNQKRQKMLSEKVDLTAWMLRYLENYGVKGDELQLP